MSKVVKETSTAKTWEVKVIAPYWALTLIIVFIAGFITSYFVTINQVTDYRAGVINDIKATATVSSPKAQ